MYMLPDACCSTSSRDDKTLCSNVIAVGATSSLRMVPTPWLRVMTPPLVALLRLTNKVSSGSTMVSPLIVTEIVCEAWPAAKLKVPEAAR